MKWFLRLAEDVLEDPLAGISAPPVDRKLILEQIRGLADQLSDDELQALKAALESTPGPEDPEMGLEARPAPPEPLAPPYELEAGDPIDRWTNMLGRPRPMRRRDERFETYTPEQRLRMERHRVPIAPDRPVGHPSDYPMDPLDPRA